MGLGIFGSSSESKSSSSTTVKNQQQQAGGDISAGQITGGESTTGGGSMRPIIVGSNTKNAKITITESVPQSVLDMFNNTLTFADAANTNMASLVANVSANVPAQFSASETLPVSQTPIIQSQSLGQNKTIIYIGIAGVVIVAFLMMKRK